ncbi:hypothetical protein [Bifidobacterium cuniculi]|uniref:Uncharacterized protein n=1 Tax=Bifidobacterium cuniculi TaxID=1688 RepID=A0A087AHR9_9BIFI|nr:hypothetical protein [Bifidobacterium cuniculi]KFI58319.1 hypothetical protein BCUN_1920 [Bifidobacterium cuniculi]
MRIKTAGEWGRYHTAYETLFYFLTEVVFNTDMLDALQEMTGEERDAYAAHWLDEHATLWKPVTAKTLGDARKAADRLDAYTAQGTAGALAIMAEHKANHGRGTL